MTPSFSALPGSIAEQYDSKLGPVFFEPYAQDLAARVPPSASRVLEIAAGTGIASRALLSTLPSTAHLTVTDLQPAMLDLAAAKVGHDPRVELRQADAMALPFAEHEFDLVVCQFGVMFFQDALAGLREVRRVLTPDGVFLMSTWGRLADNPIDRVAFEEVSRVLAGNVPPLLTTPFAMDDPEAVTSLLHEAGFSYVRSTVADLVGESPSAHAAAMGLLCGSPVLVELQDRGIDDPRRLVDAVAARLAREGGFAPMRLPMRANVFAAQ